jgi:hypothetical protein
MGLARGDQPVEEVLCKTGSEIHPDSGKVAGFGQRVPFPFGSVLPLSLPVPAEDSPEIRPILRPFGIRSLAEAAKTNRMSLFNVENEKRAPTLELSWRIATALGVSVSDLLPAPWHQM